MAKKAIVVGLGASGEAAARLLVRSGYSVIANDANPKAKTSLTDIEVIAA